MPPKRKATTRKTAVKKVTRKTQKGGSFHIAVDPGMLAYSRALGNQRGRGLLDFLF